MLSFHNDAQVKEKYLNRVKLHIAADNLIKGTGWSDGKGCAIGCTLEVYDHACYPIELGLPEWLAHLEDKIFENLPNELAQTWPQRLLESIPIGVNVDHVKWQLAIWRHEKQISALKDNENEYAEQCRKAIQSVIDYCKLQLTDCSQNIKESARSAAESARSAAWSAARSARSAAWSAARSAESAAWSAESAAWSAESAESAAWSAAESARSAAESAAWSAESARSAAFVEESEMILQLLKACK